MKTQNWFHKDTSSARIMASLTRLPARPLLAPPAPSRPSFAAKLRPHELIAMLTHHYARVRARAMPKAALPRVKTTLSAETPRGKQAVTISFG